MEDLARKLTIAPWQVERLRLGPPLAGCKASVPVAIGPARSAHLTATVDCPTSDTVSVLLVARSPRWSRLSRSRARRRVSRVRLDRLVGRLCGRAARRILGRAVAARGRRVATSIAAGTGGVSRRPVGPLLLLLLLRLAIGGAARRARAVTARVWRTSATAGRGGFQARLRRWLRGRWYYAVARPGDKEIR